MSENLCLLCHFILGGKGTKGKSMVGERKNERVREIKKRVLCLALPRWEVLFFFLLILFAFFSCFYLFLKCSRSERGEKKLEEGKLGEMRCVCCMYALRMIFCNADFGEKRKLYGVNSNLLFLPTSYFIFHFSFTGEKKPICSIFCTRSERPFFLHLFLQCSIKPRQPS
ncbi:hypothetical protein CI102_1769 [Trichoderma harzianum]|nr:hypothetical protein CI102_1769 [Trichoderma harzianum]